MAGQLLGWTGGYHIGKGCLETRGWSWSPEWPGASSLMRCRLPTWWGVRLELELSIGWGAEMILTGWLECLLVFNQLPLLWDLMGVSLIMCCLRAKFSVVLLFSALLVVSPACFQSYLLLFSCSVLFNCSLQPHGLQYARLPCPSPSSRVYSNSCPLSQWRHATISSSVPFSSCLQSFPASGSFQMSQFFASGGQNIGVSASASILPMNIQGWSPLGWTGWISLQSKGVSRVFSNTTFQKHQFFSAL